MNDLLWTTWIHRASRGALLACKPKYKGTWMRESYLHLGRISLGHALDESRIRRIIAAI